MKFLLFLLFICSFNAKYIEYKVFCNDYGIPSIVLRLGTPNRDYIFHISTIATNVIVTNDENYDYQGSSSFFFLENASYDMSSDGQKVKAKTATETFLVNPEGDEVLENFHFIMVYKGIFSYFYPGLLGFENYYRSKNDSDIPIDNPEDFSFIEQLYKNNYITHKVFALGKNKSVKKLYIGDDPANIVDDINAKTRRKKCALIQKDKYGEKNSLFQCQLDSIYTYDDFFFKVDEPATFSIGGNVFCVTPDFFEEVCKKYFKRFLDNGDCRMTKIEGDKTRQLRCKTDVAFKFRGTFSFVFGKWNVKVKDKDIWMPILPKDSEAILRIMVFPDKLYDWCIPSVLFLKYITYFNKESQELEMINY